MNKIIIKNGCVIDPINKIKSEIKDILIENGQIVESFSSENNVKEINASGKTVIPAGIDMHSHVASQQVNWARLILANEKYIHSKWHNFSLESIARHYISQGYTFFVEANVFPSLAKQTSFNFSHIPVLDKAMLLNVSTLWPLELEFQRGKIEDMAIFLSNLLEKTKAFGIKAYNPFESESWDFKKNRDDISINGRLYNFNALNVYENLAKANELLELPHSVHVHVEGYEHEQGNINLDIVLKKIKSLNLKLPSRRNQIFHLAHANSYFPDASISEVIKFFNNNQEFDLDLGFIGFNAINPLITSDRRLVNSLRNSKQEHSVISMAAELEGDAFASVRSFDKSNEKDCFLWANAIEIALQIRNKYQVQFSLNYPNYANISDIPKISSWLLSPSARKEFMKGMNADFIKKCNLIGSEENLNLEELIIITRSSPARSLGIAEHKGQLGINADGDLNILNMDAREIDPQKDYSRIENALTNMELVLKRGEIVKNKEKIDLKINGKIFWSMGSRPKGDTTGIISKKNEFYQKYGSMFFDSMKSTLMEKNLKEL
ncbi:MAG: amidohydrolase family protein [Candidatus Lokiarchaeota archaeon]|nr:amidohydrolase family protein [Candidatus Lokiarchaeota archaeon]